MPMVFPRSVLMRSLFKSTLPCSRGRSGEYSPFVYIGRPTDAINKPSGVILVSEMLPKLVVTTKIQK